MAPYKDAYSGSLLPGAAQLLFFFLSVLCVFPLTAAPLQLPDNITEPINVSPTFESYEGEADGIDSVRESTAFRAAPAITIHRAFSRKPVWFRFRYSFASDEAGPAVLTLGNYIFLRVDFYIVRGGAVVAEHHTGSARPFATRPLHLRDFTLPLPPTTEITGVYIRIESTTPLNFTPRVRSLSDTQEKENTDQIVAGLLFGAQAILALYNFFLFISLRNRSYLFYSLYIFGWLLFETKTTGFIARYILFAAPAVDVLLLPGTLYFTISAFVLFTEHFLYPNAATRTARWARGIGLAGMMLAVPLMFLPQHITIPAAIPVNLIVTIYVTSRAFMAWRQKVPSAGYFLSAVLCSIALLPFFAITRLIPVTAGFSFLHFIFHYGVPMILLAEALLLSFALADRYRRLREDKERQEAEFNAMLQAEKARINAELHDVIGSDLSLLRFSLVSKKRRPRPAELEAKLDLTLRKLREMVALNNIDPALPQHLCNDLRTRAHEIGAVTGLRVDTEIMDITLTLPQAFHLQRIYGEALTNAARHARATQIRIRLKTQGNHVFLAIADNGRGMAAGVRVKGAGLQNIADRAKRIAGRARLFSGDKGTSVAVRFPV